MRKEPQEKRVQPRYTTNGRFLGSQMPLHQSHRKSQAFEGKVKNISDGGFCVIAARAPERGGLLQGRLVFPRVPARIPTLVQVRWIQPAASGQNCHVGLQYVI
jgi:PilZ domain-containing protein